MRVLGLNIEWNEKGLWLGRSSLTNVSQWFYEAIAGNPSTSGESVTENTAMQLSTVFACVSLNSNSIAQVPLYYYTRTDDGKTLDRDDPINILINEEPNEVMSAYDWRKTMESYVEIKGNAFSIITRNGNGQPTSLSPPVHPDEVEIRVSNQGNVFYDVRGNEIRPEMKGIPARNMIHLKGHSKDGYIGQSLIESQKDTFGEGLAAQKFANRFWKNGAAPSVVVNHPGKLSQEGIERMRQGVKDKYTGANQGSVMVLEEGASLGNVSIPQKDAQFLETRKFKREDIAAIFGVPPPLISILDEANYSNVVELRRHYATTTLQPRGVNWEQELQRKLRPRTEQGRRKFFKHDFSELMKPDPKSHAEFLQILKRSGFITANEARKELNYNNKNQDGADDLMKQQQYVPLGMNPN